jgi:hypothetical protein
VAVSRLLKMAATNVLFPNDSVSFVAQTRLMPVGAFGWFWPLKLLVTKQAFPYGQFATGIGVTKSSRML